MDLAEFFSIQSNLIAAVPRSGSRFLKQSVDWNNRLLGVVGGRGTGKTTMLLQHIAEQDKGDQRILYISADHIHVQGAGLYELAASFFRLGGKTLVIDEIHKYAEWHQEVKNLYDSFPNASIYFSGSSTLGLQKGKGDLSRRAVYYTLPGLSFREYLLFAHGLAFQPVSLPDLLNNHPGIASRILKEGPVLGRFKDYLDHGVYPFFLEGLAAYQDRLSNVVEKVLYEDIPTATATRPANVPALKRILWLVATSQPFAPNIEKMSRDLKISKPTLYAYLDYLEKAMLLAGVLPAEMGFRLVRKPSKIYMANSNLVRQVAGGLGVRGQPGSMRETFFADQMRSAGMSIAIPTRGDFQVDGRYFFEIGGKGKTAKQVEAVPDSFVVRDDMEVGFGNIIPLWLFGFLY